MIGCVLLLPAALRAQFAGNFDSSLGLELDGSNVFSAIVVYRYTSATDSTPVENILAGGDFFALSELDNTGSLLPTFISPTIGTAGRVVYTIVPTQNGVFTDPSRPLFYIGGLFGKTVVDKVKTPAQNVKRMTVDGVIDSTFDTGTGADDGYVTALLPLNDASNSLVVGGLYNTFNKQAYPHLVRVTTAGAISPGFSPVPFNDDVFAVAAQIVPALGTPDPVAPQFLVGGTYTAIGNTAYSRLARINYDGSVDTSFQPVIDERVLAIATQPDGKIIIGGQFATVNGQTVGHLARLNMDGSLDTTFNASVSTVPDGTTAPVAVYTINLLPDGRMYVGGNFYAAGNVSRHYLARLNADGSLETTFDPGVAITNSVQTIAVERDNDVVVGETVSKKVNNTFLPTLIRLYGDAVAEASVNVTQRNAVTGSLAQRVNGVVVFERTGNTAAPLTIYFTVTGTAEEGIAYRPLKATALGGDLYRVTLPAGASTFHLRVKTTDNPSLPKTETVTFTVQPAPDGSYNVGSGSAAAASVDISDPPQS